MEEDENISHLQYPIYVVAEATAFTLSVSVNWSPAALRFQLLLAELVLVEKDSEAAGRP